MTSKEYVDGLRQLADFYELHPDLKFAHEEGVTVYGYHTKEDALAVASILGNCKKKFDGEAFFLVKGFGPFELKFYFAREQICERIVVRTETIPEYVIPAHTKDIVEWKCNPLLQEKDA